MNTEQIRPVSVIPLRYITDQQYQKAANGHDDHNLEPTIADEKMPIFSHIGTGQKFRADTVYLLLTSNGKAISLGSRRYVESLVASKIARTRFYEEIEKTREIRQLEGAFVAYKGFSSYRSVKVEKHDTRAAENLRSTFGEKDIQAVVSDNERHRDAIEQAVSANLQGEFYVMQLKAAPWTTC